MKRFFYAIALLVICATISFAKINEVEINLKGGIQPYTNMYYETTFNSAYFSGGKHEEDDDENTSNGFSLSAEGFIFFGEHFGLGIGGNYFTEREMLDSSSKFSFSSLYAALKYKYSLNKLISAFNKNYVYDKTNQKYFYGVFHLGQALIDHDFKLNDIPLRTTNGLYCAIGTGLQGKFWLIELLYSQHQAKIDGIGYINNYPYYYAISGEQKQIFRTITLNIGFRFNLYRRADEALPKD
ncbi:MAG: hypothetical protein LBD46_08605 [Endomicrobium sp.]|jgi:hypothetical protein|nr:hypothetical protein [Endomicrobium sp.]